MKIKNPFFKKEKYINLNFILKLLNKRNDFSNSKINNITDLVNAKKNDISFFNSLKYLQQLKKTKASYVIVDEKHVNIVKNYSKPIVVKNVLIAVSYVTEVFYPDSLNDAIDFSLNKPDRNKYNDVKFGKNVLVGKNVKIGSKSVIGHNTIIESNVTVGKNSIIGNNVLLKNSLIGNNVKILDCSIIGKKGFGFFTNKKKNIRYPHIGMVVIGDNVEIGCNNTIDRGSLSNTMIGKNTFIDNQVHIAHNVVIGENCVITAQVGFAGSSLIGNNVQIGGQAGISGHLKIGNDVQIGGGSGVIKNIPDNSKVMGYPAKDIRKFIKENK